MGLERHPVHQIDLVTAHDIDCGVGETAERKGVPHRSEITSDCAAGQIAARCLTWDR